MTILNEGARAGDFLLSEAAGQRSREQITLLAITDAAPAGTVVVLDTNGYKPYVAPNPVVAITKQVALLFNNKPASTETQDAAVIIRDAEVDGEVLFGLNSAVASALASQGIIVR